MSVVLTGAGKEGFGMPLVQVTMAKGRTDEQRRACMAAIAHAVHDTTGAALDTIRVWITELELTDFSVGGVTLDEVRAQRTAQAAEPQPT